MIRKLPVNERTKVITLFNEVTYWSSAILGMIEGNVGDIYVDDIEEPSVALLHNKIIQIICGNPKAEAITELLKLIPKIAVIQHPKDNNWIELLQSFFKDKLQYQNRTKFSSQDLNLEQIRSLKTPIPDGFTIVELSESIINRFDEHLTSQYEMFYGSIANFISKGFGFCALDAKGEIASLAACANPLYNNEFEIDISTNPNYRRMGLATITCAYLIEYSLLNGFIPHWDAANEISTNLALKLGYTKPEYYKAALVWTQEE